VTGPSKIAGMGILVASGPSCFAQNIESGRGAYFTPTLQDHPICTPIKLPHVNRSITHSSSSCSQDREWQVAMYKNSLLGGQRALLPSVK
jgi:hypothetical protein